MGDRGKMNKWQPITSAPKDGQHILIVADMVMKGVYEAYWDVTTRCWYRANVHYGDAVDGSLEGATDWMALPDLPKRKIT